jgi:hypothetical protein
LLFKKQKKEKKIDMTICSKHKVSVVHKEGVSKLGKPYSFDACPEKDNGDFCKAEHIEAPEGHVEPVSETREPLNGETDWDAVARGSIMIEAFKIAHSFYSRVDIDDEEKIDARAEHIFKKVWEKRVGSS